MYHENYSKSHETRLLKMFKHSVLADFRVELDFRSYVYAENGHNLTPAYNCSKAVWFVDAVIKFWNRFGVDIGGRYNRDLMIERLQTTRLKTAVEQWLVSEISEALFDDAEENKINFVAYYQSEYSNEDGDGQVISVSAIPDCNADGYYDDNELTHHTVQIKSISHANDSPFDEEFNFTSVSVIALIDSVQHTATFNVQLCGTEYEPQNGCWFTTNGEDMEFTKNEQLIESCFEITEWAESEARTSAKARFTYHDTKFNCLVSSGELFAREDERDGSVTLSLVNHSHNSACDYGKGFDERESFVDLDSAMSFLKPFRTDEHNDYDGLMAYINASL